MVGQPRLAGVVHDNFAIMARTGPTRIAVQYYLVIILQQGTVFFVHIGTEQTFRPRHTGAVGAPLTVATRAGRAKKVIVTLPFIYIRTFVGRTGYLHFLCTGLHGQTVAGQLDGVDAVETAPNEPVFPSVLDVERVDAVAHTYLKTAEQFAVAVDTGVGAFNTVGIGHADAATVLAAPLRHGIVEHILLAYSVYIRRPKVFHTGHKGGPAFGSETFTQIGPVDHVRGTEDVVTGGKHVERAVFVAHHTRVGPALIDNGVLERQ